MAVKFTRVSPYPLTEKVLAPLLSAGCKMLTGSVCPSSLVRESRSSMPTSSRRPGAGYDRIDVEFLTKNGVYWANSPTSVGQRTADSTAMMILMALRGTSEQERNMREGKWMDRTLLARDARTCTLGIIGMGNIGRMGELHGMITGEGKSDGMHGCQQLRATCNTLG